MRRCWTILLEWDFLLVSHHQVFRSCSQAHGSGILFKTAGGGGRKCRVREMAQKQRRRSRAKCWSRTPVKLEAPASRYRRQSNAALCPPWCAGKCSRPDGCGRGEGGQVIAGFFRCCLPKQASERVWHSLCSGTGVFCAPITYGLNSLRASRARSPGGQNTKEYSAAANRRKGRTNIACAPSGTVFGTAAGTGETISLFLASVRCARVDLNFPLARRCRWGIYYGLGKSFGRRLCRRNPCSFWPPSQDLTLRPCHFPFTILSPFQTAILSAR